MLSIGNEHFQAVNNWLGWGDPNGGLWFIGMEERETFTEEAVALMKDKTFAYVCDNNEQKGPVANRTAKIVAKLLGIQSYAAYRDSTMWREGSKVFNGNLLPLGKQKISAWPDKYSDLFGLNQDEYNENYEDIRAYRHRLFTEFRGRKKPQGIVCFGKKYWNEFEELFAVNKTRRYKNREFGVVVYDVDHVILTGHFSYGRWFPNKSLDFVAKTIAEWNVDLPT